MSQRSTEQELELWERRHHDLAEEVDSLERRALLTPQEQDRVTRLKKEKLVAKDHVVELKR